MIKEKVVKFVILGILAAVLVMLAGSGIICVTSPHLVRFSRDLKEFRVELDLKNLPGAVFLKGMGACENIYLDPSTRRVYITSLSGSVYLVNGNSAALMAVVKSKTLGTMALGIDRGPDGCLYVGVSSHPHDQWMTKGGSVYRMDMDLNHAVEITGDYPSLNGIAFDGEGRCWFASSNFRFLKPKGKIYRMRVAGAKPSAPEEFIPEAGLANGLFYDRKARMMYMSNTIEGVFSIDPGRSICKPVYFKTRLSEATDDLCVDRKGRVWMTDPGDSFIKMLDPEKKILVRFIVRGVGQTSSCRIREENGKPVLYVTEIKRTQSVMSESYDGRGLVILPIGILEKEVNRFWREF